jgi:hypothetical protein
MNEKSVRWLWFLPFLALSACRVQPTVYPMIIIDTYNATGGPSSVPTYISLFGATGDPTLDTTPNLWNDDADPYTVDAPPLSIAENRGGNPNNPTFSRIDYTGGLPAGTYYLRVRAAVSSGNGPYAIRVLVVPDEDYTSWLFGSANNPDTPYESDDLPQSGGVPSDPVPIAIGERLNRYLTAGDVDWFVLTLPQDP